MVRWESEGPPTWPIPGKSGTGRIRRRQWQEGLRGGWFARGTNGGGVRGGGPVGCRAADGETPSDEHLLGKAPSPPRDRGRTEAPGAAGLERSPDAANLAQPNGHIPGNRLLLKVPPEGLSMKLHSSMGRGGKRMQPDGLGLDCLLEPYSSYPPLF